MDDIIIQNSINFFTKGLNSIDKNFYIEMPVNWAEDNRVLPVGATDFPGKINMDIQPHHKEIMNCLHPDSGVKRVTCMKSVQASLTTSVESVVGWAIKNKLYNILMLISSKNIGKTRGSAEIDTMIDQSGLADFIKPMSNRTLRKLADNTMYKEFGTHRLMITSYNSIADLKSLSWDLIVMDELTEAPKGDLKKQGDVETIIHGRTKARRNAKIIKFSTPETAPGCRIYNNFKEGDRRFYYVPCPLCGEEQILVLKAEGREFGLAGVYEENKEGKAVVIPDSINYICEYCKKSFYEYQKSDIMIAGRWIPTFKAVDPAFRSYHMSGLMSNSVFYPWKDILSEFSQCNFGKDIMKFKGFVNNTLGWPWENRAKKKNWEYLRDRKMDIERGIVPPGGLIITGGVDVQKDRLELQLVAWGHGMESWSFENKIFYGDTSNYENDSWLALSDYVYTQQFKICKSDMLIARVAIDTGYNPGNYRVKDWGQKAHIVYNFVNLNPLFIAIKGVNGKNDILLREKRNYDVIKSRYDVNVDLIKEDISMKLDLDSGPGAMHFVNYEDEFFKQFLSEAYCEVEPGKWGWKKTTYERNESWDTWIYARAAAEHLNLSTYSSVAWDSVREVAEDPRG
jgi:phage terminase large subunit GpA-like protein